MLLYYIRHGDPIYDPDSLTPLGHEQAKAVARRLALHGIDKVFTSTSNRAIQTAQPLCELLKLESIPMDWCSEKNAYNALSVPIGNGERKWALTHAPVKLLLNSDEIRKLGDEWYDHPALANTGMKEGVTGINRELDAWLESLGYRRDEENHCYMAVKPNEERVALFAHWGAGGAIMSHILSIPWPQFGLHFTMSHTAVTVIEFQERDGVVIPKALSYANDSHIYKEGLPTKFANRIYI